MPIESVGVIVMGLLKFWTFALLPILLAYYAYILIFKD